jgi:HK97 family phage major capsid protein
VAKYTAQIVGRKREKSDLVEKCRRILDKAESENKRATNTEERAELDRLNTAIDEHDARIKEFQRYDADDETVEGDEDGGGGGGDDGTRERGATGSRSRRLYFAHAKPGVGLGNRRGIRCDLAHTRPEYRKEYNTWLATGTRPQPLAFPRETRAGTDVILENQGQGGYLVAPVETTEDIVKQIDNLVFIRQICRYYKVTTTQAIGVRQMLTRVDDSDWTTEIAPVTADTSLSFGRRDLTPHTLTKLVRASIRIIEAGVDAEEIVNEELAYKNAVTQEKAFLTGSGTGQPLGVFVASPQGIPTTQDILSSVVADFAADDLIAMKYGMKQPYFFDDRSRWVMGRPIVQQVRTFKDTMGQYIWRAGLASDRPDTILDVPLAVSEYAPTTKTTGSYIAILGNFGYYAVAEFRDFFITRLNEFFQMQNEIGFISRSFVDGAPVLGEAFVRLKTK